MKPRFVPCLAFLFAVGIAAASTLSISFQVELAPAIAQSALHSPHSINAQAAPVDKSWVERSNQNAQLLIDAALQSDPEGTVKTLGLEGFDDRISDFSPGYLERQINALETAKAGLQARLSTTPTEPVKQDLEILIARAEQELEEMQVRRDHLLPYHDVAGVVFAGLQSLLDGQIPPARRQAALIRLKRYAGQETGYTPLADLMEADMRREWRDSKRVAPLRAEVENSLKKAPLLMAGIEELFQQYKLQGYEADLQALYKQVEQYNQFVQMDILPRTRRTPQPPEPVYAFLLKKVGVDIPVAELRQRSLVAFRELQTQMQVMAAQIAKQRGLASSDYRDVIRALKQDQIAAAEILPFYKKRIKELETIIQREGIVTLPHRKMSIRLATQAETAESPSPHMVPPPLLRNTGQYGEFILPLGSANGAQASAIPFDDFVNAAVTWPIAVHEGRPGHELQFTSMVETGVSITRALFAFNNVNVEGWALYMEGEMFPYLPLEGQFTTLWMRMWRAARVILDTGLNQGTLTLKEAQHILENDLVISKAFAQSELDRYTFSDPGQATSYFAGYLRMMELRAETELVLGDSFNKKAFHDFILSQGLLPPALMKKAVFESFIPIHHKAA